MVGDTWKKKGFHFANGSESLLNMTLFHFILLATWLGKLLVSCLSYRFQSLHHGFGSMLPTPFSVTDVQENLFS